MKVVGLVLLVLCLVFLVAFSLEIVYLVWCRRCRRSHNTGVDPERQGGRQPSSPDIPGSEATKESSSSLWFCMLCCKWKRAPTRIEPSSSSTYSFPTRQHHLQAYQLRPVNGAEYCEEDAEVAKARGQYASRELFTIREEEEGTETDSAIGSGRRRPPSVHSGRSVSGGHDLDGATPFATPCGSPMYLTPASSPPHTLPPELAACS